MVTPMELSHRQSSLSLDVYAIFTEIDHIQTVALHNAKRAWQVEIQSD